MVIVKNSLIYAIAVGSSVLFAQGVGAAESKDELINALAGKQLALIPERICHVHKNGKINCYNTMVPGGYYYYGKRSYRPARYYRGPYRVRRVYRRR